VAQVSETSMATLVSLSVSHLALTVSVTRAPRSALMTGTMADMSASDGWIDVVPPDAVILHQVPGRAAGARAYCARRARRRRGDRDLDDGVAAAIALVTWADGEHARPCPVSSSRLGPASR
jgi:hypothetical protein